MKWVRGNGLLAGFLPLMISGLLVLGYLLYDAYGSYSRIAEEYGTQARELDRLQSLRPYPDSDSLKMEENKRNALADRIEKLQSKLASIEVPLISLTPEQFQDELRKTVSEVAKLAAAKGTSLPQDFYLGFQQYRDTLPASHTASSLGRELEAIKLVVCALFDNRVDKIVEVDRNPRSQAGDAKVDSIPKAKGRLRVDNQERSSVPLLTRHSFQIGFTATQLAFRRVLNRVSSTPRQYYIVDLLNVANEELAGPPRGVPSDSLKDDSFPKQRIQLIVGDEKLIVRLRIQIVDFVDPNANSAESGGG